MPKNAPKISPNFPPIPDAAYGDLPQEDRQGEIHPLMSRMLYWGIYVAIFAALCVGAFTAISFVAVPFAVGVVVNALFAGSVIYLAALSYGIVNDIIACKKNLPYFLLGHQPGQRALFKSNKPNVVAVGWGIIATWPLALIAGIVFSVATLITGLAGAPFAAFVLPVLGVAIPLALWAAHRHANKMEKQRENTPRLKSKVLFMYADLYQFDRLEHWLKDEKDANAWLSNSDRNSYGYRTLPLIGLVGVITLAVMSAISAHLPAILFSAAVSVFPVIGLSVLLAVGVISACAYMHVNRNVQVNNGFRLDYPDEKPKPAETNSSTHGRLSELSASATADKQDHKVSPAPHVTPAIDNTHPLLPCTASANSLFAARPAVAEERPVLKPSASESNLTRLAS